MNSQSGRAEHLRWNFSMGIIHGILLSGGLAFVNPDTIIPVFLANFTKSKTIIGLASTIMGSLGGIGVVLPQLLVASKMENKLQKMHLLKVTITVRTLLWGFLALAAHLFAVTHPGLTVLLLFFVLMTFTLMGGIATVPYYDIWAKAIPSTLRGRFFGYRQFWGGFLAVGAGIVAKTILGSKRIGFPNDFALLFLFASLLMAAAYTALGSVKEPIEEVHETQSTFPEFMRKAFRVLKSNDNYRKFLMAQILIGASAFALPFYVLYAREVGHVRLAMVGVFLSAQMLGSMLSNVLWAYLSDFVGNRRVIQVSALLSILVPLIALVFTGHMSIAFVVLFALAGSFLSGGSIGRDNFLLDIAPSKDRPVYIALNGTLSFPIMIFPLLGGIIVQHISYGFLFAVTAVLVTAGCILSFRLKEPRKR